MLMKELLGKSAALSLEQSLRLVIAIPVGILIGFKETGAVLCPLGHEGNSRLCC